MWSQPRPMGQHSDVDTFASKRGFKIITWNIRSLFGKINEFTALTDKLGCEVINVCETWLNSSITNEWLSLPGYELFRFDRKLKRKGGGLCTYVKDKYKCDALKYKHLNVSVKEVELMILEICLPATRPMIIVNCYRPPSENVDSALNEIKKVLDEVPLDDELYVVGDLNLDYSCTGSPTYRKLINIERSYHLKQYIVNPTRVSCKSSSLIDHIYSNSLIIAESGTLNVHSSDHYPCYVVRKKQKILHTTTTFKCRKLKYFDHNFFRDRLEELNWRHYYDITDPDTAWEQLFRG